MSKQLNNETKDTTPTSDLSTSRSPDDVVVDLIYKQNEELKEIAHEIESFGAHYLGPIIEDDLIGLITFRDYNQFSGLPKSLQTHFHHKHSDYNNRKLNEKEHSRNKILKRAASRSGTAKGLGINSHSHSLDITKLLPKILLDHYMKVYGYVRQVANQQKPQTSRIWLELFTDLIFVALIGMSHIL